MAMRVGEDGWFYGGCMELSLDCVLLPSVKV